MAPGWRAWRQAVGVLRGIEAAIGMRQLAAHVLQGVLGDLREEPVAGGLRGLEVRQHQLRLVVQHLLEVRDTPRLVDRVAVKAAPHVVAHTAQRHRAKGVERQIARHRLACTGVLAQQEQQLAGPRELRRAAKPAVPGVIGLGERRDTARQHVGRRGRRR